MLCNSVACEALAHRAAGTPDGDEVYFEIRHGPTPLFLIAHHRHHAEASDLAVVDIGKVILCRGPHLAGAGYP